MKADKQFQGRIPPTSLRHLFEDRVTHRTGASHPPVTPSRLTKHLERLILPHLRFPMEGNLRSAGTGSLEEVDILLQYNLANKIYIRNLGTQLCFPGSSASCHRFGSICLLPQDNFVKTSVELGENPSLFPFSPSFSRSDRTELGISVMW